MEKLEKKYSLYSNELEREIINCMLGKEMCSFHASNQGIEPSLDDYFDDIFEGEANDN